MNFKIFNSVKKVVTMMFALAIIVGFFIGKVEQNAFFQLASLVIGTYVGFSINRDTPKN